MDLWPFGNLHSLYSLCGRKRKEEIASIFEYTMRISSSYKKKLHPYFTRLYQSVLTLINIGSRRFLIVDMFLIQSNIFGRKGYLRGA